MPSLNQLNEAAGKKTEQDSEILWEENNGFVHPAQDFFKDSEGSLMAVTSQEFRVKEQVHKEVNGKVVTTEKYVQQRYAITSRRDMIPLKKGSALYGKLLQSIPSGYGGGLWHRPSLQAFLADKIVYGEQPGQVSFYNVYVKIKSQLKIYMELEEEEHTFIALWVMHTYFIQMFKTSPILFLNAIKGSGKSKLLEILSFIAFNGLYCVEPSSASVFRVAHQDKATILIDELENIRDEDKKDLRTLLHGRYKYGMTVPRVVTGKDKEMEIQMFNLFGSTALANISGLDTVLEDRCATLILKRALNPVIANTQPESEELTWREIRSDLYCLMLNPDFLNGLSGKPDCCESFKLVRFYLDYWNIGSEAMVGIGGAHFSLSNQQKSILIYINGLKSAILPTYSTISTLPTPDRGVLFPGQKVSSNMSNMSVNLFTDITSDTDHAKIMAKPWLVGRTLQLWKPILIMAACVDTSPSQEVPQGAMAMMLSLAERFTRIKVMEDFTENPDVVIVEALVKNFRSDGYYALKPLCEKLREDIEWIKPQTLGRALKRLGFDNKRKMKSVEYFLSRVKLEEVTLRLRLDFDALLAEGVEERRAAEELLEDSKTARPFSAPAPRWDGEKLD